MKAEKRSAHLSLSISPGLKAHLEQLYRKDKNPHCGFVYLAASLAEYGGRLLEECTGYWEKRRREHLRRYGVMPLPSAGNIMTFEDLEFLRGCKINGGFLPDRGDGPAALQEPVS